MRGGTPSDERCIETNRTQDAQTGQPDPSLIRLALPHVILQRYSQRRDLMRELVVRELKERYKRSVIGIAWSLLNPLAQWLVLSFVFSLVVPVKIAHYSSFVFSGILVWTWFQGSLLGGAMAITGHGSFIRQPGFPVALLPVVVVATNLIHFLLALPVLFGFLWIDGQRPSLVLLALPLVIGLQFLLSLGMVYVIATINVTFRDTQHLLAVALLLFFYLTPVFYDVSAVPEQFRPFYWLNPLTILLDSYRRILLEGSWPQPALLAPLGLVTLLCLWLGHRIFVGASYRFVEEL